MSGSPKKRFEKELNQWLLVRNKTIEKLQELLEEASKHESDYDNINLGCKYGSASCKELKLAAPTESLEFLTSLGSLFCDVVGGLSSVTHVIRTEGIQSTFREIMDKDEIATKKMYDARSRYVTEYFQCEEIIRKFGGTTIGETLCKISDSIGITEFFNQIKKAEENGENSVVAAVTTLDSVISRNCSREVGREVLEAVEELMESNPACVDAAVGVGRSLYGVVNLSVNQTKRDDLTGAIVKVATRKVDEELIAQDHADIRKLERKIQAGSESSVGKQIDTALLKLKKEKAEMLELFHRL